MDVDGATRSVQGLVAAAQAGGFGIHPELGGRMKTELVEMQHDVERMNRYVDVMKRRVKLGTSPAADAIARQLLLMASGDEFSADHRLEQLKDVLVHAVVAVDQAVANYQHTDDVGAWGLRPTDR